MTRSKKSRAPELGLEAQKGDELLDPTPTRVLKRISLPSQVTFASKPMKSWPSTTHGGAIAREVPGGFEVEHWTTHGVRVLFIPAGIAIVEWSLGMVGRARWAESHAPKKSREKAAA